MFKPVEDSPNLFVVTHTFAVSLSAIEGVTHKVRIPKGYKFDGASIPRVLWSIIGNPFEADLVEAACVHDYYCDNAKVYHDRVIGDNVFFALIARRKTVGRFRACCLYAAVRLWTFLNLKKLPLRYDEGSGAEASSVEEQAQGQARYNWYDDESKDFD